MSTTMKETAGNPAPEGRVGTNCPFCLRSVATRPTSKCTARTICLRATFQGLTLADGSVFRTLLRMDASAAILVHQHPSSDPTASASDLAVTKKLTEAGEMVGIALVPRQEVIHPACFSVAIAE